MYNCICNLSTVLIYFFFFFGKCRTSTITKADASCTEAEPTVPENMETRSLTKPISKDSPSHQYLSVSADHDYSDPPASTEEQLTAAHAEIQRLEKQVSQLKARTFFLERFSSDQQSIMFYTGFKNYNTLVAIFNALRPTATSMVRWSQMQRHSSNIDNIRVGAFNDTSLTLIDQFFLFLCRVKQGFPEKDLSIRFGVSQSSVS